MCLRAERDKERMKVRERETKKERKNEREDRRAAEKTEEKYKKIISYLHDNGILANIYPKNLFMKVNGFQVLRLVTPPREPMMPR